MVNGTDYKKMRTKPLRVYLQNHNLLLCKDDTAGYKKERVALRKKNRSTTYGKFNFFSYH